MANTRVIKRYANRKLYDTQHSRYVTLEQIAEMIREGDDVAIVDNKSKEDLTSITLAQIIFEEEKRRNSFLPLQTMRNIIQTGGESISQLVHQAKRNVSSMLPPKKRDDDDDAERGDDTSTEKTGAPHSLSDLRDWIHSSQRSIDEWQKRVDERIRNMVGGMSRMKPLRGDVRELAERIAELEAKLAQLDSEEPDRE